MLLTRYFLSYDLFGTACLDFHVRLYDTNKFMLREKWDMGVTFTGSWLFLMPMLEWSEPSFTL